MTNAKKGEIITYDQAKNILEKEDIAGRRTIAGREETAPEILYYMASEDKDASVRQKVAGNNNTPALAQEILADDDADEVRLELARKIGRIIPNLRNEAAAQLRETTIKILERLAADELPKIRQILALEIQSDARIPVNIVNKLARDKEVDVAAPILEYSPLLNDTDLKEIIAAGIAKEALVAIAKRQNVSENVADAIVDTLEIPAVAALLTNKDATIRSQTMDQIVKQAEGIEDLHEPLTKRPNLSLRIMKRISSFVARALINNMVEQHGLSDDVAKDLLKRSQNKIDDIAGDEDDIQHMEDQVTNFYRRGMIDDEFIVNCIDNHRRSMIIHALSLLTDVDRTKIDRAFSQKNARVITALCWKAGFKMRTSLEIQNRLIMVNRAQAVLAKDGLHYPFDDNEMRKILLPYT